MLLSFLHSPALSERVWPLVRVLLVFLLFSTVSNLAGWGAFVLLVDKLGWLGIEFHGKTLVEIAPERKVLGLCILISVNLAVVLLAWRLFERKRLRELLWSFEAGWGASLLKTKGK